MQQPSICTQLITARKQKGLTQEELAALTNLTVRTIQRIESGDSQPRAFTLKAIAAALGLPFETLIHPQPVATEPEPPVVAPPLPVTTPADTRHFLQLLCLSCFSYILVPYVHFIIPAHLLKKQPAIAPQHKAFAQQLIRRQVFWMVSFHLLLLLTLAYNLLQSKHGSRQYVVSYVWVVLGMYALNAIIIAMALRQANRLVTAPLTA